MAHAHVYPHNTHMSIKVKARLRDPAQWLPLAMRESSGNLAFTSCLLILADKDDSDWLLKIDTELSLSASPQGKTREHGRV